MSIARILFPALVAALAGCGGGQALLKDVQPLEAAPPVAQASDGKIVASIDAVIVRNGRGAWASDADWDEYLVRVRSTSGEVLTLTGVAVFDALDIRRAAISEREELIEASRDVETQYGQSGQLVKTKGVGWTVAGGAALVGVGVMTTYGAAAAATSSAFLAGSSAAGAGAAGVAAATGVGLVIVGGVLLGSAVVRAVRNSDVNDELKRRATPLPSTLGAGSETRLDVFVPMAPLPRAFEITYTDPQGERRLRIDTAAALAEAHREMAPNPDLKR